MTNTDIARALYDLAEALELTGSREALFRVRALRTAGQAIEALHEPAVELHRRGELTRVKGVGEGIARRVEELATTGKLAELASMAPRVAPGMLDLVRVEGIGPKTARRLYDELGITSLDALEAAARAGQLRTLPRFGAQREQQLLAAIERARTARGRVLLSFAEREAEPVVARLRAMAGVERVEVAGSVRRREDTVADVDILVATRDAGPIMEAFTSSPSVALVVAHGPTKSAVKLRSGLQVDVRAVAPESFGAALHYFTGSKAHNIAVRALGVRRGLKINEYGVFEERGARRIGGAEERDVFAAVGLPWIPPELREDRGELAAAAAGALPRLIELGDVRGDLHLHTTETDGRATIEEMVNAAAKAGRRYVAVTDHSQNLKMVRGMDAERLRAQGRAIAALNERAPIPVLRGIEADILLDGSVDLGAAVLGELDWVIGSVHSHFHLPRAEQTARIVRAIESGIIDALGHPTGRLLDSRPPYDVDVEAVVAAAARAGVALELNSSPDRLDLSDEHCRLAREAGVLVVIDTDAHSTAQLGFLKNGIDVARRGWLEPRHVLNARSYEELRAHLAARRARRV